MVVDPLYADLINREFWELYFTLPLAMTKYAKKLLLPQTIKGRAFEGHGGFNGKANPNVTLYDIVESIQSNDKTKFLSLDEILAGRQKMVDDFEECLYSLLDGRRNKLVNSKGEPLFGVTFLEDLTLDLDKESFKGIVLAGRMDSHEWRQKTAEYYNHKDLAGKNFEIGSGKEYLVNIKKLEEGKFEERLIIDTQNVQKCMDDSEEFLQYISNHGLSAKALGNYKKLGLIVDEPTENSIELMVKIDKEINMKSLSKEAHSDEEIEIYKNQNLIVDKPGKGIESIFIRHKSGLGTCDDLSLMGIGLFHNPSAMILGYGMDAVDTLSKLIERPVSGGVDESIGENIFNWWYDKYHEELVTPEECMRIIYFGAKNNYPKVPKAHSSSHRRFNQYELVGQGKLSTYPTFVEHLNFVESGGKMPKQHDLGFARISNKILYRTAILRLQRMHEGDRLPLWKNRAPPRK